jgi:Ser/Thr protein kinase RdoA (MazF antagonist)
VLRRFGGWRGEAESLWEVDLVTQLAACGLPVPAPIGPPRRVDGALYILMPFLAGRALGAARVDEGRYRELGRRLAEFHVWMEAAPVPAQRPGWTETTLGAWPVPGGPARGAELIAALAQVDAGMARRVAEGAEALQARDLPRVFAAAPRMVVQCDFAPWNIRLRRGRLVGVLDFEGAHVDVRAADLAFARRGHHDAVVEGYLERASLPEAEIAALDGLWLGGVLGGLWRVLEGRLAEGSDLAYGLDWHMEQLAKTRPYRG